MSVQALSSRAILGRLFMRLTSGSLGWIDRLSMFVDSDQEEEEHKWLGMTPALRQWEGGRLVKGLRDNGIKIRNLKFEGTVGIPIDWIRRDKTMQTMQRIDGLANRANTHGATLLSSLIEDGESSVCYDGQYYFDTDHAEGDSGTQSNVVSVDISALPTSVHGSTTKPAPEEMQQCILEAAQRIFGFKDDQGEPINETEREFIVMVPTPLWMPAITAVGTPNLSSGQTNVIATMDGFTFNIVPNPRLTWTTDFAMFAVSGNDGAAPFIKQEEKPLEVKAQAEGSNEEFYNDRHVYGVDYNGNHGYGFWQKAAKIKMT